MTYQYPFHSLYRFGTRYGHKGSIWKCGWHSGLDIFSQAAGGDGRIYPIAPGIVLTNNVSASYGNYISLKHEDGYISLYAHMAKRSALSVGAMVDLDTILGQEGSTGNSTAVHLHLEIHKDAYSYPSKIDPEKYLLAHILTAPAAIEMLAKKGIVTSPAYWLERYRDVQYLDKLLISLAVYAGLKQATVTTLQDAVKRLYSAGVISVMAYWFDNAGKIKWLDKLLISAAQYV